jgi:hypothetical protein
MSFILVFLFLFVQNIFAEFVLKFTHGYCECCDKKEDCECYQESCYQKEKISIDTNKTGVIRTIKKIDSDSTYEMIKIISDVKGNLIFTEHYIWKGEELLQMIYNGITSNIINFPDPCYFVVIEPSGDSISFRLDPKSKLLPKDDINFIHSRVSSEYKFVKDTTDKYELIKYYKQPKCRNYHGEMRKMD